MGLAARSIPEAPVYLVNSQKKKNRRLPPVGVLDIVSSSITSGLIEKNTRKNTQENPYFK